MTKLAQPGAGLPLPELLIARIRFRWICWRTSDQTAIDQFQRTQTQVLELCKGFNEQQASTQVLIKRLRGLEDSSRDWSIYMTLEHLQIVNDAIGNICALLSQGGVPAREVSTADVKPSPETGATAVNAFEESCTRFVKKVSSIDSLKTSTRFNHPWFGPLDGSRWLVLAAFHMKLHLAQLHRISQAMDAA